ncbi:hypothetical protein CCACVL1_13717 [Corchorus capsularis]|uniref:CCHC-type domain-containing protein n=1 Tax=Corchorus capsularis TaxID=210143 RepID=A0A1R3I9V5_COCAP|nr:hypothetical protein CCACVL1_13717 [Corchorus capsularis]
MEVNRVVTSVNQAIVVQAPEPPTAFKEIDGPQDIVEVAATTSFKDALLQEGIYSKSLEYINCSGPVFLEDLVAANEVEPINDDLSLTLSTEDRNRIRDWWSLSLIVKVFGKKVGYRFLASKLKDLWEIQKQPLIVDLGNEFFMLKFHSAEDLNFVIKEGPWFIAGHFLTMRKWEPNFRPSAASFSSVAVWVRLLELPVELFEEAILKKIGSKIGLPLKIDSHTLTGERGKYTRICVQINLDKALAKSITIEGVKQPIVYEGIGSLCFHCGKIGHKKEVCPEKIPVVTSSMVEHILEDHGYGPWMVVQARKSKKDKSQLKVFNAKGTSQSGKRLVLQGNQVDSRTFNHKNDSRKVLSRVENSK